MCEKIVVEFCNKHNVKNCTILLAVSGGSDSVALFHLFVTLKEWLCIDEIGVAHVNHGLRPGESEQEEKFVSQLAIQAGCRFHVRRLDGKSFKDSGVEQWARNERYGFFSELMETFGYRYAATGHTADDQAETVLMRIYRGSGLTGLCGIKKKREDGVIRPLITLRREKLRVWLEKNEKKWYDDPSNCNRRFKRNYIRHRVIPDLLEREPNIIEYLVHFAEYIQEQMRIVMPLVNKWITEHVIEEEHDRFVLCKPDKREGSFPASEGIALLFRKHDIPFEKKHIVGFLKDIKRKSGCFILKGGWRFFPGVDSVEVIKESKIISRRRASDPCELKIPGQTECKNRGCVFNTERHTRENCEIQFDTSNNTVYVESKAAGEKFFLREVKRSDTFRPLGFAKPVHVVTFLKNQGISKYYRNSTYVLVDTTNTVIWIPGVAINHEYRIKDSTRTLLKISRHRIF